MSVYVNNITIDTGAHFSRDFYLDNIDGSSLDLTGYTAASQIRKHPDSVNATANFTVSFIDRTNGRIRVSLGRTTTAEIKPGRYMYDVMFTDDSGDKSIVIEGNVLASQDITPQCLVTSYTNAAFGAISEDGAHDSGIGSGLTQITIDDISEYGVVAFGHYSANCLDLPNLTTKFQDSTYMEKIQDYLSLGGVVFYIGEYGGCGDTAAHNTRLGLLGTSMRLINITSGSNISAPLQLTGQVASNFPASWTHSAVGQIELNSGTAIYGRDQSTITVAYEKYGSGAIVLVADSNEISKNPQNYYTGFRDLVLYG